MEKSYKGRKILDSIAPHIREMVLEYLSTNDGTTSNNTALLDLLDIKPKKLEDILKYLEHKEDLLIKEKQGRAFYWKLKDKKCLNAKMSNKDAITLNYALDLNRNEFDTSTMETLQKLYSSNANIKGLLSITESFENEKLERNYDVIMDAIKEHKYLKLTLSNSNPAVFEDVKPIKFVFIDDNWYVAFEYTDEKEKIFRLGRLSFIKEIEFLKDNKYSNKNTFQTKDMKQYLDFLDNDLQNSFTFYGIKPKKAKIKATGFVAQYFEEDMKKFFKTQTFIEKLEDGGIVFTVDYTNDLEILPFIQKWMPDMVILEPKELQESYITKIESISKRQKEEYEKIDSNA